MLVVDDRYNGDKFYNKRNLTDMIVAHNPTETNSGGGYMRVAEQSDASLWLGIGNTQYNNYLRGNPISGHGLRLTPAEIEELITVLEYMKNKLEEKEKEKEI